jgi:hypothetical protein
METITQDRAKEIVKDYRGGQFFTVTFVKRTTGETRVMNCRKGVRKGASGAGLKFNPASKNLVSVWDRKVRDYRFISLEGVRAISIGKRKYRTS